MWIRRLSCSAFLGAPKKFKLPTKFKGVRFLEDWDKTPCLNRQTVPNYPSLSKIKPYSEKKLDDRSHAGSVIQQKRTSIRFSRSPPLPTTFGPNMDLAKWMESLNTTSPPLTDNSTFYPYKYYEVKLERGFIGLNKKIRAIAKSLGLNVRDQVVYVTVSPRIAGKILKIKELVSVRLVNEVPEYYAAVDGFKKVENIVGRS
jgi:ribosomal protein L30